MYRTAKDLRNIVFPVYRIPDDSWYIRDKVLFLDGKVLDEKNMPGTSLGIRRLQCGRSDLFPLKKGFVDVKGMLASGHKHFIDSAGVPFTYIKTQNLKLKYHKIASIESRDTYSVVRLEKLARVFNIPRPPLNEVRYARVLYYGPSPWILYDFSLQRGRDSHRRV